MCPIHRRVRMVCSPPTLISSPFAARFFCTQCTDCTSLDLGYTTISLGALTSEECVCKAGYFMNYLNATFVGGVLVYANRLCEECPTFGYDCRSPGNALDTLRIEIGYTRSHNLSTLVRQCYNKVFCTPSNVTTDLPSLGSFQSHLGVCATNHAGPFCALCSSGYIMKAEGCVECEGSRSLTFVFPVLIIIAALGLCIFLIRSGRTKAVAAFADSAMKGAKREDEAMLGGAFDQYRDDRAKELNDYVRQELDPDDGARSANNEDQWDDSAQAKEEPLPHMAARGKPPVLPNPPPPTSPPTTASLSDASVSKARSGSLFRQKSILRRTKEIAARRGCTPKRIASAQTKFRIIVSLVQVLGQLGVVFSIPFPDFYKNLVSVLGVFSLDLLEIMPLECSFALNHDHYLLIRTLLPLAIALVNVAIWSCLRASAARKRKLAHQSPRQAAVLHRQAKANEAVADTMLTITFVIFYLLYPSNSANIFATFQCETLDDPQQSSFLRKDFKVDCKTPFHQSMQLFAIVMVFVYPLGIPALYAWLLFYKHGTEMQLLKSLEVECQALKDEQCAASELAAARDGARKGKRLPTWATPSGTSARSSFSVSRLSSSAMQTLKRWKSEPNLPIPRGSRASQAARRNSAVRLAAAPIKAQIEKLEQECDALRTTLPDYVQKLILGYEVRPA